MLGIFCVISFIGSLITYSLGSLMTRRQKLNSAPLHRITHEASVSDHSLMNRPALRFIGSLMWPQCQITLKLRRGVY